MDIGRCRGLATSHDVARYFCDEATGPPIYMERLVQTDGRVDESVLTECIKELEQAVATEQNVTVSSVSLQKSDLQES